MAINYCKAPLNSRSRFATSKYPHCNDVAGHKGRCSEFPFLSHLKSADEKVAKKVQRDSMMTTGAPWKSDEAGPNRILRYAMLLSDEELTELGVPIANLDAGVVQKLRAKSASYDDCIRVAEYLALQVYEMPNGPPCPTSVRTDLELRTGLGFQSNSTTCLICREPLDFGLFSLARRGKAEIETAHANPRMHKPGNVGFAHRNCNIAQGEKNLEDFYEWIAGILHRNGWSIDRPQS